MNSVAFVPSPAAKPIRSFKILNIFFVLIFLIVTYHNPVSAQVSKLHQTQAISFYLSGGLAFPEPDDDNYGMGYAGSLGLRSEMSVWPTISFMGGVDRVFSDFPRREPFVFDLFDVSEHCKGTGRGYRFLLGINHTERWGNVSSKTYFGSYGAHLSYRTLTTKWKDRQSSYDYLNDTRTFDYASGIDRMRIISPGIHLMWTGKFSEMLLRTTLSGEYNINHDSSRDMRSITAGYDENPFRILNGFSFGLTLDIGYTVNY